MVEKNRVKMQPRPEYFLILLSRIHIPFLNSFPLPHPVFFRLPITYTFPAELMHVAPSAH
jgi:hypothetical protein